MRRRRIRVHDGLEGGAARVLSGAAVLLVAALAADAGGVAALPGRSRSSGQLLGVTSGFVILIGLAGLVLLGGLVVVLARSPRRRQDDRARVPIPPLTSRLLQVLVLLVALAAVAAPVVLLVTTSGLPAATTTSTGAGPAPAPVRAHRTASGVRHHLGRDALLLAALTGACVALAAGATVRQRHRDAATADGTDAGDDDTDLQADVAAAASAAAVALDVVDGDPRAAVIAAYTAMTRTFTAADPQLRATDTPGRLLQRAAAAGMVDMSAATMLIRLFEHARFSRHPVTPSHVAGARDALARVRASSRTQVGAR